MENYSANISAGVKPKDTRSPFQIAMDEVRELVPDMEVRHKINDVMMRLNNAMFDQGYDKAAENYKAKYSTI